MSGNPVELTGGTLADSGHRASRPPAGINLTGTIPAGQTVTANGSAGSVTLTCPVR